MGRLCVGCPSFNFYSVAIHLLDSLVFMSPNIPLPALIPAQCFRLRRRSSEFDQLVLDCGALAPLHQQDLANCLPFLACGEESAAHTFAGRLSKRVAHDSRQVLRRIANDELRHAAWLARLQMALPMPDLHLSTSVSAAFFRGLITSDAGLHFARIAALDLAVCRLLAGITHHRAALATAPAIREGFRRIAQDEARHVHISRSMAATFGVSSAQQSEIDRSLAAQLCDLLAPVRAGLSRLSEHAPKSSAHSLC
jgi:demethoxyubiquinone hydroxylase (CLK1/Coq7/Cat5 family)